jgi:hypothetical protein
MTAGRASRSGWEEAEGILKRLGVFTYQKLIDQAAAAGETHQEFLARLQWAVRTIELPSNLPKLEKPVNALVKFLQIGVWPAQGLQDPDAPPPTPRPARPRTQEQLDTEALVLAGTMLRYGNSEAEIHAEQDRRGLPRLLPMTTLQTESVTYGNQKETAESERAAQAR